MVVFCFFIFDLLFILVDECNEVMDYAIARRIVDLHSRQEEAIKRTYSLEDIQRYITFARLFKPKISKGACDFMVEEYKRLRQRDSSGTARSSWRITVRQLESMIRLSEAMARMHCQDEVQPKHVKEACRLLSKSIIRIEQPDIELEEDTAEEEIDAEEEPPSQNGVNGNQNEKVTESEEREMPKKVYKLSYVDYKHMANLLVLYIRKKEEDTVDEDDDGVRYSELVNWYLKEMESEIESEAELIEKKILCEKVIYRLVHHDHILIELQQTGIKKRTRKDSDSLVKEDDPILVVHPNYIVDV